MQSQENNSQTTSNSFLRPGLVRDVMERFNYTLPADYIVRKVDAELIQYALDRYGGNITRAAQLLGRNRTTLRDQMVRYGLYKRTEGH